jgi:RecB family endonuclease NucS
VNSKPYVWQMIKEAVENLGGKATYSQIKEYIKSKYGDVNENTINCQIVVCTVNHPSRIHYHENKKPRIANSKYDFLFSTGRGQVELYDPEKHGVWEIRRDEYGKLVVAQTGLDEIPEMEEVDTDEEKELLFPLESHLRDFIARNMDSIKVNGKTLKLYVDEFGRDGIEYPTEVGPVDILALDNEGNFVIFELKLSRGTDKALGQILRYMGWVKRNLAKGKRVKGVIVAKHVNEKLKYATTITPDITLLEYELDFRIKEVSIDK